MAVRPATLRDFFDHMLAKNHPLYAGEYSLQIAEVLAGRVFVDARRSPPWPSSLGGIFVPDAGGPATAWFSVVTGSSHAEIVQVAFVARSFLRRLAPVVPDGVATYVADDNQAGARLARFLGFQPTEVAVGQLRRWLWHGGYADRQDTTAAAGAGARGAGAAAA